MRKKKRSKFRLTLSVLALGVLVLAIGVGVGWAATAPAEVWVDDNYTDGNCDGHTWSTDAFAKIQDGIDNVAEGGTVHVAAGTYYNEEITIDKPLTLQGENRETTIIDGDESGISRIVTVNTGVNDVTFTGFTVKNATDCGIYLDNSSGTKLIDNICSSNTQYGIHLDNSSSAELTNNTCNLNTQYGIYLDNSSSAELTNNTCNLNTQYGIYLDHSSITTLTGNTITNNENGIFIDNTGANTINIKLNNIDNKKYGVKNDGSGEVNAIENWWGHASGPHHATDNPDGKGNAVSDNVDYNPWYVNADKTTLSNETDKPTVSSVSLDPTSPVKDGSVTFTIVFSETMDTGTSPTVTFGTESSYDAQTINETSYSGDTWIGIFTIEAGYDGEQHISISGAKDLAGNIMITDTTHIFVVDTDKPGVSSVEVSPDPAKAGTVTLTVNFDESLEQPIAPTVTFGIPSPYNTRTVIGSWQSATQWEGTATVDDTDEGTNTVKISGAQDLATNVMDDDTSKTFVVDKTAPTSPTISIDEGDYTNTTSINLTLSAVDATEMYISGDITGTPSWIAYATSASVTLTTGDGSKTVSVKDRDAAGNETSPVSDAITLDTTKPTVSITDPAKSKTVSSASYTIKGTANDPGSSGIAKVEVSIDDGSSWNEATGTSSWTYDATLTLGANIIKARSTDNAGNVSGETTGVTLTMAGSLSTIELGASKLNIPANGSSTSTITAVVSDEEGNPVADGTSVAFTTSLGTITSPHTTSGGVATATLTSGTTSGTAAVKATVNGVSSTIYITFTSGAPSVITIGLTADPKSIVANGSSTSTITAVVSDEDGNPVADGTEVSFITTLGTITTSSTTTNGVAKAILTSGASSGTATISASSKGVSDTTQVDITADVVEEEVTETISGGETDSVEGPAESDTTVKVTATDEVEVTITNYTDNPHPEATSPMDSLDKYCDVSVSNPDAISWPIRVEMSYTEDEIAAKGLIEESLKLYYFKDGAWHECSDTGVDTINNIVWAEMTREEASGSPVDTKGSYYTTQFLEIDKSVDASTAVTGDIITYTVKLTNISTHDEALDIEISDKLPFDIVYISGSTAINGVLTSDPSGSNPFSWCIDVIAAESTATITYKCAIGLNTVAGFHDNEATIKSYSVDGITLALDLPRAMARVKVVVFETKGIIIGKVFEDLNGDGWQDKGEPGIPGIDIVMEDGTTVTTDVDGKYSIPGVEPGYHVLTIDEATLPEGYEILGEVSKFVEVPEVGMAKLNSTVVKQQEGEAKRDPG